MVPFRVAGSHKMQTELMRVYWFAYISLQILNESKRQWIFQIQPGILHHQLANNCSNLIESTRKSMTKPIQENSRDLEKELTWFEQVVDTRFKKYFGQASQGPDVFERTPPDLKGSSSHYASIVRRYQMSFAERLCLILALVPHIRPKLLDVFYTKNKTHGRPFTEFGGLRDGAEERFFPTGETLAFLLTGQDLEIRFALQPMLSQNHFFTRDHILNLSNGLPGPSPLIAPLRLSEEFLGFFTTGEVERPRYSAHFPARFMETTLRWKDLVLPKNTLSMVQEIESWIRHGDTLMNEWEFAGKIRPGYRALFYGPPGTGKTITACLLGKSTGHDVYRIHLSAVVSRYIGETEKNLARVFDKAESKNWILFFDEADALFGKRSKIKDAHDRYANQEVSYLLQRLEMFNGISILALNRKKNIDKALMRRFGSVIHFPMPGPEERVLLWKKGFSDKAQLSADVDLSRLAKNYELSGGTILNVIGFASLQALKRGDNEILMQDVLQGIKPELVKEGKVG